MWVIHPETIVFSSKGNQQIYSEDTCINSLHYLNDVFWVGVIQKEDLCFWSAFLLYFVF